MRVFSKLDGKLSCLEVQGLEYAEAIELVRSVIQAKSSVRHKNTVLALVKY